MIRLQHLAAAILLVGAAPVMAQPHGHPGAPGEPAQSCSPEHAAMGHCTPAAAPPAAPPGPAAADPTCPPEHAAMEHCTPRGATPLPTGDTARDPTDRQRPAARYADRVWGAEAMESSRALLRREHGGMSYSQVMVDIAELQIRDGRDGYRWEAEGWFGGDVDRLVVKTEGEGDFGHGPEDAEIQALYSRAIGPYFNLQGGLRHDFRPDPSRTYAAIGIEGLAPYWFEVEAHAFLSTRGDVLGRVTANYDQRITQRLILQPRAEINLAAQEVAQSGIGSGLTDAEIDLRLRYEFRRELAPYLGVSWERKLGETARLADAAGRDRGGFRFVAGLRTWF